MAWADVVVVGGGPAGSSLAFGLRGSGLRVVVLDRARFPRDKTCAGWVTPPVFAALGVDPIDYARGRVLQPIHGFRVRRMGGRESATRSTEVVSYGIRRFELDAFLLERCGAEVHPGRALGRLERVGERWRIDGDLETGLLVGAGGHFCPVARRLSTGPRSAEPLIAAKEIELRMTPEQAAACPVPGDTPDIGFTRDLKGYGWVFRKGDWLNVGLGRQDRRGLTAHLRAFLVELRREGRLPAGLAEERLDAYHGHAYLLYDQAPRRITADGMALVGDAAGLAYPRSGEGIRPAVESGLMLARALREAAPGASGVAAALSRYEADLLARFGSREHRPGPTDRLPAGLVRFVAGRLLGHPRFARDVVVRRWFLHADDPPLAWAPPAPPRAARAS